MSSREVIIWIDKRWYDALSKHLKGETLEEHLENVIDQMCNQLPEQEYERISALIWQEQQEIKQAQEASRRFAVFHVTEAGSSTYFVAEENLNMLQTACRLRSYCRKPPDNSPMRFTGMFSRGEKISREQFDAFVAERLDNTGRVTGAFDIDMDKGRFDALHIMDGWQCFRIQDISTAAYYASKKTYAPRDERWKVFLDRLDGKQLTQEIEPGYLSGSRTLRAEDISFSDEVMENGNLLNFYMEVIFDPEKVFGTHVCTDENDDYVNVYANYDMDARRVCDTLDVCLVHGDGSQQNYKYRLTDEEQALLLPKMEDYCQQRLGRSLEECCARYLAEANEESHALTMEM